MAITTMYSSLFNFSTPGSIDYYRNLPWGGSTDKSSFISEKGQGLDASITARTTIAENTNWELYTVFSGTFVELRVKEKATNQETVLYYYSTNAGTIYGCVGYDENENRFYYYYAGTLDYQQGLGIPTNTPLIKRFFDDTPLITYQWSSVPAISGKNGILSLTTLKEESINDGSPVDDATASAFNNAPNRCSVGGIVSVDLPIVDDNPLTIAVKYNIPELTDSVYSSCKVVAKKNKIPKSKTDGDKILDVSPSSHGCVIKGLEQETKYYVVVFVEDSFGNKAESEPGGPVRTGKQDGIFKIRITTSQGVKDNDFKEVITIAKQ